ncbi:hypothetical protein BU23DRAFT_219867 [Bimuria novae-zelandiae CBS 107.79]|uniref:Transcription factor domain-containing protein n=1 Tax=Bimuria novae-zelandiae CBS 107.79 TaxID=1447943 RepID=A0A6A5UYD9_9PLEO|nr:hypothetical protein BU23DRAFT_219867 [Bimuria novae-zelandiae CBS 107.79]
MLRNVTADTEEIFVPYDPIDAGLLDDRTAETLLREFRDSCASAFPFVVIPQSVNAKVLRKSQPFLLHAILTATAHRYPGLQRTLAGELKDQISYRIIKHSHKSLELLQGLLLFTGWYHFYYHPVKQQLATMLQLCVAMVQDLDLSKNPHDSRKKWLTGGNGGILHSARSLAEKRAFLGTFHLTAAFSQAWRKRTTLTHTRYMDQCCRHLAECQEYPSDALITPLIQLSALICRVNDFFSYDDIENAEFKGEAFIQMSASNFENELARLAESIPQNLLESHPTLRLSIRLSEIWIYECAVHGPLWDTSGGPSTGRMSAPRLQILSRCLNAVRSYLKTVIAIPDASIHNLSFPSWSAWCYACIIACKLVFLEEEHEQQTGVTETYAEVFRVVMDKSLYREPGPCLLPTEVVSSTWDPIAVAKETEMLSLFHQMYNKMKFTLPEELGVDKADNCDINPLSRVAQFQRNILCSLTNRMNEHIGKLVGPTRSNGSAQESTAIVARENWVAPQTDYAHERQERTRIPLLQNMQFNSMNFESIAPPEGAMPLDGPLSDWLWNSAVDDFTMPSF